MRDESILKEVIQKQDQVLIGILNDARIPSYITEQHSKKYNELHIKIKEVELFGDDENR